MGKKYANPPIEEALCELRFSPDTQWDLTVPGLFYEKIKKEFPYREQRLVQEVEITQGPQGFQQQIRTSERIFLFAEGRRSFVQLGPRLLSVHILKPYPEWLVFKRKIETAWRSLLETIEIKGLERISLRYINRILIPISPVKLEEFFDFYPFLGPRLPQEAVSFIVGSEFVFANGRDRCRVQLINVPSDTPGSSNFFLDIEYSLSQPKAVEVPSALDWVEGAHERVELIFEGCITERLRELFR